MNDLTQVVKVVFEREGLPPISKKDFVAKFENCPFLGPYKYQDGATYEG
jgi:hypothetical protein